MKLDSHSNDARLWHSQFLRHFICCCSRAPNQHLHQSYRSDSGSAWNLMSLHVAKRAVHLSSSCGGQICKSGFEHRASWQTALACSEHFDVPWLDSASPRIPAETSQHNVGERLKRYQHTQPSFSPVNLALASSRSGEGVESSGQTRKLAAPRDHSRLASMGAGVTTAPCCRNMIP